MKKLLILFIVLFAFGFKGYSQMVVEDPANLGVNIAIQSLNQLSSNLSDFMATVEKLKIAVEVFDQIATIAEIMEQIDQLACLMSELQFNLRYSNNYACLTQLNHKAITMNLSYITDIIVKVFLTKNLITMATSERIQSLNDILNLLRSLTQDVSSLNLQTRAYAKQRIVRAYVRASAYMPGIGFYNNRYHNR